jgi:DNA-binding MarR family transcriptional regulator
MQADQRQETAFGHLMQECSRLNRRLVAAVARLTGGSGITGAQWGVLGALGASADPLTVAEASRRLGLTRQGVQRVTDVLEKKGLIEYQQNPRHRRAKLAIVTAEGRTLLNQLQERQSQWVRHAAGELNVEQVEAATLLVRQIGRRLMD